MLASPAKKVKKEEPQDENIKLPPPSNDEGGADEDEGESELDSDVDEGEVASKKYALLLS